MTFRDRLGRLTFYQACQLFQEDGAGRIQKGGAVFAEVDFRRDVFLGDDLFWIRFNDSAVRNGKATVSITLQSAAKHRLHVHCDRCESPCLHEGAALAFILEERQLLGLSGAPDESVALEHLTERELIERALEERRQRARVEPMRFRSLDAKTPWTDYTVTNHQTGKSYRVALRGQDLGASYCSCPDFRTNQLGTCKHILHILDRVNKKFPATVLSKPYRRTNISMRVDYGVSPGLRFNPPTIPMESEVQRLIGDPGNGTSHDADDVMKRIRKLQRLGHDVHIYPDAERFIDEQLLAKRLRESAAAIRSDPARHPLRKDLLRVELLPYQLDGIAFAVGSGRAILADDMGLGKTIQGVGTAELLARWADIRRVLIVCPATLKSQWRSEISRFCDRESQVVVGSSSERIHTYQKDVFYTICNYEQVLRDLNAIERVGWDLIILDEGQRIKNWETKTSRVIKSLQSRFALVLSGTPLENRLDDLYSVAGFIAQGHLGPAYRFYHRFRMVGDDGRVVGYKNLDQLRETLRPILLRRTRNDVMRELPERTNEYVRITPTAEQMELHDSAMRQVSFIIRKSYFTEMDLLRLRQQLAIARMSANSSFLVEKKEPEYSTKLERLTELFEQLFAERDRKIVLFSEWTRMLDRIEKRLKRFSAQYVRLDGSVPQKKRAVIVDQFQTDPDCRLIMMSNAGTTGLNLQAANTVVNVDLPWNPAVLEQRIGRAHRMGQKRPVQVYLMISEGTIEERMLATLSAKQDLAMAALDVDSSVNEVEMASGMEDLKRRLEKLLSPVPLVPVDRSQQECVVGEALDIQAKRDRVAAAGGQLLGAAFELLSQLVGQSEAAPPDAETVASLRSGLDQCVDRDATGRPRLSITLDDDATLQRLAQTLASLLVK